jgi:hypothetical protein
MCRWQVVLAATVLLALSTPQAVGVGGGKEGGGKIRVTVSGDKKSARANTSRPGAARAYPRVSGCQTWTVSRTVTVPGPPDADGKPTQTTTTANKKWRRCPGYDAGTGVGQPFRVVDGSPDGEETAVIIPESPVIRDHGFWYTQRIGYVFIDAVYGTARTVAMVGDPGEADLVLQDAVFDPGITTKNGLDAKTCSREEILAPYNPARDHYDQDSCSFIYMVSSYNLLGNAYPAKLRLTWRVTQIRFRSGAVENPPNLILESDSPVRPILVEEIQALVPCKSISANGCG